MAAFTSPRMRNILTPCPGNDTLNVRDPLPAIDAESWMDGVVRLNSVTLNAWKCGMHVAHVAALANALHRTRLTRLTLSRNRFGAEGVRALASALAGSCITELNLSWVDGGDDGLCALARVLPQTEHLQILYYQGNGATKHGTLALAKSLGGSRLTRLMLSYNPLSAQGIEALAIGLPSSCIISLGLEKTGMGDDGLVNLSCVLQRTPTLEDLDLRENDIGHIGAAALCRVLDRTRITRLNLELNYIGWAGAGSLAAVLDKTLLVELDVQFNHIFEKGLWLLAHALPSARRLRTLKTAGNLYAQHALIDVLAVLPSTYMTDIHVGGAYSASLLCGTRAFEDSARPVLQWNCSLDKTGAWNEQTHANLPEPLRVIIATVLVIARSKDARTRQQSHALNGGNTLALYALFCWIGRLKYFETA